MKEFDKKDILNAVVAHPHIASGALFKWERYLSITGLRESRGIPFV
jgi:hypothetical protein